METKRSLLRRGVGGWIALVALLVLMAVACGRGRGPAPMATLPPSAVPSPSATAFPSSDAPLARLIVPAIGIDQGTVTGTVDPATNTMVAPEGAFDIAYYEYSARPGRGNAVFSGHVDYIRVGPAVFWRLRELKPDDQVILRLTDGLELRYRVTLNGVFDPEDGPWQEILGKDAAPDVVTLVTCAGFFNSASGDYSERRVVRAVRAG